MYVKDNKMGHTLDITIRVSILLICLGYIVLAFPGYAPLPELTAQVNAQVLNTVGIGTSSCRFLRQTISMSYPLNAVDSSCT
jgi:hypothetical protein